jgi:gliding motility-associated-like protein
MNRIPAPLLLLIGLLFALPARASHLLGGEIGYQYVSTTGTAHTYKVILKFFSDCSSTSAALPLLINADPRVALYNNGSLVNSLNLVYNAALSDVEITPVCPDEVGNTQCTNINNPIPGVKLYVYEGNFTLNGTSNNWSFQFEGSISIGSNAGRTPLITNANVQFGNSLMYLTATLNNTNGPNSTSTFTSVPTPFFCLNNPQTYNLGAVDPDGDALSFGLIPAKESMIPNAPPPTDINYNVPYSATSPVPSVPGTYSFSNITGQLNFTPDLAVNSVVVNLVSEFRSGVMVGSSMREMSFIMLTDCPNQGPAGPVVNLENANADPLDPTRINACQVDDNVSFDIQASDPDNDNIEITTINLPAGAVATVSNNNTPNPVMSFSWNIGGVAPGDYVFYLNLRDDGCPVSVTQTIAYTIRVNPTYAFGLNDTVEICKGGAHLFYGKYYYATGIYDTTFATAQGCDSTYYLNLKVNPLPNVVLNNGNGTHEVGLCPGATNTLAVVYPETTTTYQWFNGGGILSGETGPQYIVSQDGSYWVAAVTSEGCRDTSQVIKVVVYPQPDAEIEPLSGDIICAFDTLDITAVEGTAYDYRWSPEKAFRLLTGADVRKVRGVFTEPTQVLLTVYNQFGCSDTASVLVQTKPCCEVFVPNAFSPNGDDNNDYFNPKLQAGQILLTMQVFDRWGKLVYNNTNLKKGWDGKYESGKEAASGTYMYFVKYTCADGKLYEQKESLTLIR